MTPIRQEIASAAEAYQEAEQRGDMNALVIASARLYDALGQPLGKGLGWVWVLFETWTTTN